MISAVAERFEIHPQTLRLYEREGLIKPARSAGNTRLYDEDSIRRRLLDLVKREILDRKAGVNRKYALVKVSRGPLSKP
jgi:MerR family transcriptional regulator/heat shock protein HspR